MIPLLFACVAVGCVAGSPLPQRLTEEQFKQRARSLDNSNVFMIEGYSQVRRQGGRSFNSQPINFPTLTVKNPNQLKVQGSRKVKVNLASPVYKENAETLNSIRDELEKINAAELDRFNKEQEVIDVKEVEQEVNDVQEVEQEVNEVQEVDQEAVEVTTEQVEVDVIIEEEVTTSSAEDLTTLELNTEAATDDDDEITTEEAEEVDAEESDGFEIFEPLELVAELVGEAVQEEGSGLIPDMSLDMDAFELVEEDADNSIVEEASTTVPLIDFGDIQEITTKDA